MTTAGGERMLGAIEQITLRALEKKPEHRYQSMQELVEDLDRVIGGEMPAIPPNRPSNALADALEPRTRSEMNLQTKMSEQTLPETRRWLWAGVGVAGGAVVLGLIVLIVLRQNPAPGAATVPMVPSVPGSGPMVQAAAPEATGPLSPAPTQTHAQPESDSLAVVMVHSEPEGATLVLDGAIVGSTPAPFPRPESGWRVLELRLDGYQTEKVSVDAGSPDQMRVQLRKRLVQAQKTASPPKQAPPPRRTPRRNTEVVDPWEEQ
jgi:serine/threonine-protein kinase